jgi:cytoskeletal protein RodZ
MFERNRIAETLRSAREERGLSLEQAAAAAGIPLQYIRLLEGESNVRIGVSDELYLIPFFRKYAAFVGIDAEGLLPEFLGAVQQVPGDVSPPIRLSYRSRWAFLWKPASVVFTIAVAVVLMLRQSHERPGFDDSLASDSRSEPVAVAATATVAPFVAAAPIDPTSAVNGTTTPDVTPAVTPGALAGAHELKIDAKEETWMALAVDDQPAKQYVLRPAESRTWQGDRFSLTVGNAGGITLALDGRELPPVGRPGQVVRNLRLPAAAASLPSPSP